MPEILLRWSACLRLRAPSLAREKASRAKVAFATAAQGGSSSSELILMSGETLALGATLGVSPPVGKHDLVKAAAALDRVLAEVPQRVTALRVAAMVREELGRLLQSGGDPVRARAELTRADELLIQLRRAGLFTRADADRKKEITALLSTLGH